ncbi:MAG: hypothetical protein IT201_12850 [Thermoleophilia bacterium]|nr:hypothetical protein [Thermoleophilia bacterium]
MSASRFVDDDPRAIVREHTPPPFSEETRADAVLERLGVAGRPLEEQRAAVEWLFSVYTKPLRPDLLEDLRVRGLTPLRAA